MYIVYIHIDGRKKSSKDIHAWMHAHIDFVAKICTNCETGRSSAIPTTVLIFDFKCFNPPLRHYSSRNTCVCLFVQFFLDNQFYTNFTFNSLDRVYPTVKFIDTPDSSSTLFFNCHIHMPCHMNKSCLKTSHVTCMTGSYQTLDSSSSNETYWPLPNHTSAFSTSCCSMLQYVAVCCSVLLCFFQDIHRHL